MKHYNNNKTNTLAVVYMLSMIIFFWIGFSIRIKENKPINENIEPIIETIYIEKECEVIDIEDEYTEQLCDTSKRFNQLYHSHIANSKDKSLIMDSAELYRITYEYYEEYCQ